MRKISDPTTINSDNLKPKIEKGICASLVSFIYILSHNPIIFIKIT
jgi:hypothetical protein